MPEFFERLQQELDGVELRDGFSSVDLLNLPPILSAFIGKIMRKNGVTPEEISREFQQSEELTQNFLEILVKKGYLRRLELHQKILYKTKFSSLPKGRFSRSRKRALLDVLIDSED